MGEFIGRAGQNSQNRIERTSTAGDATNNINAEQSKAGFIDIVKIASEFPELTPEQIKLLDTFNGDTKDDQVKENVVETLKKLIENSNPDSGIAYCDKNNRGDTALHMLISLLGWSVGEKAAAEKAAAERMDGKAFTKIQRTLNGGEAVTTTQADTYFDEHGVKAYAYYMEHGNLDGFELDLDLIEQGWNVSVIEHGLDYSDKSNDKAVLAKTDDGSYKTVKKEFSDGHYVKIVYSKNDGNETQEIIIRAHKPHEDIKEQVEKPQFGQ